MKRIAIVLLPLMFAACQSVGEQAPLEMESAKQALKAAEKADVDNFMPSAFQAARLKLDRSLDLLDESSSYQKKGESAQAENTREEALKLARESQAISENGMKIVQDARRFNNDAGEYLTLQQRADKADALQAKVNKLEKQNLQLAGKVVGSELENERLANQPVKTEIPANFRVTKPMAYFATGSTILEAKFRPEISELAQALKDNPTLEVTLEGYADPRGSAELNKRLAEKRIEAVAKELKRHGVRDNQLKLVTVGKTAETAAGQSSGQLQLDRKVTATVINTAH